MMVPVQVQLAAPAKSITALRRLAATLQANFEDVKMPLFVR